MDAITEGNINEVELEELSSTVNKKCGLPGEPKDDNSVKLDLTIVWNGRKFARMLKNASEVEARLWYNNHRPSTDVDIMKPEECKRRIDYLRALKGSPVIIDASETGGEKVTELSIDQLINILNTGNPAQQIFAKSRLVAKQTEQNKIHDALARLNAKADSKRPNKIGTEAK